MAHGEPVSRGSLVPFAEFLKHLQGEKRGLIHARLNQSKQVLETVVDHIQCAFGLPIDQSLDDLCSHIDTLHLSEPLPWLGDPKEAVQCLSCKGWYKFCRTENTTTKRLGILLSHWRWKGSKSKKTCKEEHSNHVSWTLPAFEYKGDMYRPLCFQMADNWELLRATTTSTGSLPLPKHLPHPLLPLSYIPPVYATDLGWWQTFESFGKSAKDLHLLHGILSLSRAKKYPAKAEPQQIELGLCALYEEVLLYLLHAEKRISDVHVSLHSNLTLG